MSEWIVILSGGPGKCPACGARHRKETPHDARSLKYKLGFYRANGRLPTWEDASAHCAERVKRAVLAAVEAKNRVEND